MGDGEDLNLFMMCDELVRSAMTGLPDGLALRSCRPDELHVWKAFPFDSPEEAAAYDGFMTDFFRTAYRGREEEFLESTKFACDADGTPVATCGIWRAYGELTTVQWFKVRKDLEGRGIGRGLLSTLLASVPASDFPVYLHTQPGSFRAVKLYSDLGFRIIDNEDTGTRPNEWVESMRYLARVMPADAFERLRTVTAPPVFSQVLRRHPWVEF